MRSRIEREDVKRSHFASVMFDAGRVEQFFLRQVLTLAERGLMGSNELRKIAIYVSRRSHSDADKFQILLIKFVKM